ncbi:MAG: hypothetical protein HUK20_07615 [Fibrobacter sp.]|nr:hypothetical protein [Fibrobacter sp.]
MIVNKCVCGCGLTEYYLTNSRPVILVSPRKELINCKMAVQGRPIPIHYFDRSLGYDLSTSFLQLDHYLNNPFPIEGFVPKILVTYDSLVKVLESLNLHGYLDRFDIIVDEFTAIFTDVKMKGTTELNLLGWLMGLPNRVHLLSATPISEAYLNELHEFDDVSYVTLQWHPSRINKVKVVRNPMKKSAQAEIEDIITAFRRDGYFKSTMIDGQEVKSTEAVFFVNKVSTIVNVAKKMGLTEKDTLVICSEGDGKNKEKLDRVGLKIGHVPSFAEYKVKNRTFTFVTRASFEGTDFYSDCSTTYVFADANSSCLALDLSIDLVQIAGRCRTATNPFRHEIYYFFRTNDKVTIDEAKKKIAERDERTQHLLQQYSGMTDPTALEKCVDSQTLRRFEKDYLDVQYSHDGTSAKAVFNKLAYLADIRAIEIKEMQYASDYAVDAYISNNHGFSSVDAYAVCPNQDLQNFYLEFNRDGNFERRMELYSQMMMAHPELKSDVERIPYIAMDYKQFFNTIPVARMKALQFKRSELEKEYHGILKISEIQGRLAELLVGGKFYSNSDIKNVLKQVYAELDLVKAAKATDLPSYMPSAQQSRIYSNNKQINGYTI